MVRARALLVDAEKEHQGRRRAEWLSQGREGWKLLELEEVGGRRVRE